MKRPIRFLFFLISISSLAQHIQWQQSLGGEREEHLYDAISTYDYGILLAGSSVSEANGNKKDGNVADLDYWLWKMTEDGKLEWQKNYGGAGNDYLYSVSYTLDGGYILGGSSDSPEGHDKDTTGSGGLDFWIIKLNPRGEIEWQKTFGGSENERLTAIAQSKNGGYWVAGTSSSTGLGNEDVWVLRLDRNGNLLWDKALGGLRKDECRAMTIGDNGIYIAAFSNSQKLHGQAYVAHLNEAGDLVWDYSFGNDLQTVPAGIVQAQAGHIVVAGSIAVPVEENENDIPQQPKTDFWCLAFDEEGRILHEEKKDLGDQDQATNMVMLDDGQLLLSGYSKGKETKAEDYTVVSFSPKAKALWYKQWTASRNDRLQQVVATQDKGLLMAGTSNSGKGEDKTIASSGHSDYWILKTGGVRRYRGDGSFTEELPPQQQKNERRINAFPIPAQRFVTVVVPFDFSSATLSVHNLSGQLIYQQTMDSRTAILDMHGWAKGVFVLRIVADQHTMERKIVKDD